MNDFVYMLNEAGEAWWILCVNAAWQSAIVGVAVLILVTYWKRLPSSLRYGLLLVAVIKFLAPPLTGLPFGVFSQISGPAASPADLPESSGSPAARTELTADSDWPDMSSNPVLRDRNSDENGSLVRPESSVSIRELMQRADEERTEPYPRSAISSDDETISGLAGRGGRSGAIRDSRSLELSHICWPAWLMLLHLSGSILFLAGAILRGFQLRRILRAATRSEAGQSSTESLARRLGLRRSPRLAVSNRLRIPFSVGIVQPAVVVPRHLLEELDDDELNVVLLHELAHHRRRDPWTIWLQVAVSALWWFHPVVWLLNRALRNVREDCCDDLLISRRLVSSVTYCRTLLKVAASLNGSRLPFPELAASMAGGSHPLSDRLRRIMDDRLPRPGRIGVLTALVLTTIAGLVLPGLSERSDEVLTAAQGAADSKVNERNEPDDSESAARRVTGRVVFEGGQPVSDADVWVSIKEIWLDGMYGPPVVGRGRSDSEGRFSVVLDPQKLGRYVINSNTEVAVWVLSPRSQLARVSSYGTVPSDVKNIVVKPASTAGFLLKYGDNTPVPALKASPTSARFGRDVGRIPDEICERMAVQVGPDGKLSLKGIPFHDVVSLTFESEKLGLQLFADYRRDQPPMRVIRLGEAGSITGQLTVPGGESVDLSKVRLRIATMTDAQHGDHPRLYGMAVVEPDREGRFTIPAIAEGTIRCFIHEPDDLPFRSEPPRGLVVAPGGNTRLLIPMRQAARVTGLIRERKSKKPIVGARVHFQLNFQNFDVRTGPDGRYRTWLIPGENYHVVLDPPSEYITQNIELFRNQPIPAGARTFEYKPIELFRGRIIEGQVVDAAGQPAAGIRVGANWEDPEEQFGEGAMHAVLNARRWATTDAAGRFRLDRLHPTAPVTITPVRSGIRLGPSVNAGADDDSVRLRMKQFDFVSLSGRVVDGQGVAVPNVRVWLYTSPVKPADDERRFLSVVLNADASGRFRSEPVLPRNHAYRVTVKHNGREIGRSAWFVPETAETTTLPAVTVKNRPKQTTPAPPRPAPAVLTLKRTVTDTDGNPIEEAHVISWQAAQRKRQWTTNAGEAQIRGVRPGGVWLFVQKPGFRFHGEFTTADSERTKIVLHRVDEPPVRKLTALSARPVTEGIRELARRELLEFVTLVLKEKKNDVPAYRTSQLLQALARMHPELGLALLGRNRERFPELDAIADELTFGERDSTLIRLGVARRLVRDDLDKSIETLSVSDDPTWRLRGLIELAGTQPREKQRRLLEKAAGQLEQLEGTSRIETGAFLASRLRAIGDDKRALELFRELAQRAKGLPGDRAGFSRGFLAWEMAPLDTDTALRLIRPEKDQRNLDRYRSNIAHQIAASRPAQAEHLLGLVQNSRSRENKTVRVCYRMASVDFERARRLADGIKEITALRALALGALAAGATQLGDDERGALIDQAYDLLQEHVDQDRSNGRSVYTPQSVSIGMLPLVEIAAPDRVNECLWRALSLRKSWTIGNTMRALGRYGPNQTMRLADPVMGASFARYDLDVARRLTLAPGDETLDLGPRDAPYYLFASLAILDPETAIRTISRLPHSTKRETESKMTAWLQFLEFFDTTTEARWNRLADRQLHVWQPGKVDF